MTDLAPVSGVMPIQDPDVDTFWRTLRSIDAQTTPPAETIIVDTSVDPTPAPQGVTIPVRTIHRPDLHYRGRTIPLQRRIGISASTEPYIWRLDEDAVFDRDDHLETLMFDVQKPDVVAACARVEPIEDTFWARAERRMMEMSPSYGLFPVYPRDVCPDGRDCYPRKTTRPMSLSASDALFTAQLVKHGRIHRNDDLVCRTSLPTTRAELMFKGGAVAAAGAVAYKIWGQR